MTPDNCNIYQQIGNLFYALAAGQHIKPSEVPQFKLLVAKEWLMGDLCHEKFRMSDATHSIIVAIDTMQTNNVSHIKAYKEFSRFFSLHPEAFSHQLRENIYHTANKIIKLFTETNHNDPDNLWFLKDLLQLQTVPA